MTLNVARIAALLNQAGVAHHEFEQTELKGKTDAAWADWYAEYLVEHGLRDIVGAPVTARQLSLALAMATESHKKEQTGLAWSEYTAEKIVEAFVTVSKN